MVRYFLTDLRGNPIYSFAQRLRRNNNNHHHPNPQQQQLQQQLLLRHSSRLFHTSEEEAEADRIERTTSHSIDHGGCSDTKPPPSPPQLSAQPPQYELYHVKNFSSMTLVCYIRNQQWEEVMKRLSLLQYQHEVYMVDATTGNTVLHTASRYNPPPDVVRALCVPDTVRCANYDGTTPLHICASHRCRKETLQTLLECCRIMSSSSSSSTSTSCGSAHHQVPSHTSPTADLSRMGRAPIHYACLSFRGLDLEAFQLLLNETLEHGNIWVTETLASHRNSDYRSNHHNHYNNYIDDDDDVDDLELEFNESSIGAKKGIMEVVNENEVYVHTKGDESRDDTVLYEFENETDQALYQLYGLATETAGWKSSSSSVDNDVLTLDGEKYHHKILVNVMGMKDATGQTPIALLFRRYRERVRCVINTVDKIRSTTTTMSLSSAGPSPNNNNENNNKAALVAAIQVHADLGELWERARWIISRLTEERLLREQQEKCTNTTNDDPTLYQYHPDGVVTPNNVQPGRIDATSRRTTYYGGSKVVVPYSIATTISSKPARRAMTYYDHIHLDGPRFHNDISSEPPSPVAQEAASWACELHPPNRHPFDPTSMMLPFAPDISTSATTKSTFASNQNAVPPAPHVPKNNHFRIVHASVGLTGYGCPPELIRLAISIHPNQVMEMDADGNLPIHIAVTAASYLATTNPIDHNNTNSNTHNIGTMNSTTAAAATSHFNHSSSYNSLGGGDDHSSVMSDAALSFFSTATVSQTTNPFDQVIKILLQHYPDSARVPQGKSGRLPLVLAIEESKIGRRRTWNDGIRTLLHAYPPALHNKKIIEPILYPHVLSLVANNGTPQSESPHHPDGRSSFAFDFSGYVDVVPNSRHPMPNPSMKKRQQQQQQHKETKKKSQRAIRQELCCRTTLYELLRSKPDWLTLGLSSHTTSPME